MLGIHYSNADPLFSFITLVIIGKRPLFLFLMSYPLSRRWHCRLCMRASFIGCLQAHASSVWCPRCLALRLSTPPQPSTAQSSTRPSIALHVQDLSTTPQRCAHEYAIDYSNRVEHAGVTTASHRGSATASTLTWDAIPAIRRQVRACARYKSVLPRAAHTRRALVL